MPERNVFISHFNEDEENIGKLKTLLEKSGYTIKNSSIDSTKPNEASNPDYIKQLIRERIRWAGCLVVLIGPKTKTRPWVDYEIEQAHKQGKRIVGVFINGASNSDVPTNFERYANALVGWNTDRIISAIEGELINWENPDGTTRPSKWGIKREVC